MALTFAVALGLTACGAPPSPAAPVWQQAKPSPIVGSLQVAVTERLAPGRVRIEARWERAPGAEGCVVDLGLPAGAAIAEGSERYDVPVDEAVGSAMWIVEFPTDVGDLDAVIRYCLATPEGMRAAQCAVRLTE
ncbi:MAG: hypothetical protein O2894_10400 [Planctomycetota bacterium]|nr:hypothetical protein [Planctomycetota bacterium]